MTKKLLLLVRVRGQYFDSVFSSQYWALSYVWSTVTIGLKSALVTLHGKVDCWLTLKLVHLIITSYPLWRHIVEQGGNDHKCHEEFVRRLEFSTVTIPSQKSPQVQLSHWEIWLNLTRNNDNIPGSSVCYLEWVIAVFCRRLASGDERYNRFIALRPAIRCDVLPWNKWLP